MLASFGQRLAAPGRQAVVAAARPARAVLPERLYQPLRFQAVQRGVERAFLEGEHAVGAFPQRLGEFEPVHGPRCQQVEQEQTGSAFA